MPAHTNPDLPEASPMIISETPTHIIVAVEIARTPLAQHRRFIELLMQVATPRLVEDDE